MKKAILTAMTVLVAWAAPSAPAAESQLTVLLAGGSEDNAISIWLTADGRSYVIDSVVPLEVGGSVCAHPEGMPNELVCTAASIGGFEVNAGAGEDAIVVAGGVRIPTTLRGGPGSDDLIGGSGADKLIGGPGEDTMVGRAGADSLYGGAGADRLIGGGGDDVVHGNSGVDVIFGGPGNNQLIP